MGSKTVCVTGASGFIASWLVKKLLEKGYTVRATVRDPGNEHKTAHLRSLPFANERLDLVKADLLDEGSFHEAVKGCEGVFHTASPFFVKNITDPQAQLLDPALQGTLNLLRAVKEAGGIKRVVLTSSVAAVWRFPNRDPNERITEENWSDEEFLRKGNMWYPLSKTIAERAAWKFAKENNIDLVVINPAMVIGKLLQATLNTSSEDILHCLTGETKAYPNLTMGWVHVEDVADAHILAYEKPEAEGRYLCIASWMHWKEITVWLKHIEPNAPIPDKCVEEVVPLEQPPLFSKEKLLQSGLRFKNVETMLLDCVESLKEKGFLKAPVPIKA